MLELEVLVRKTVAVNRLATSTVTASCTGNVGHEVKTGQAHYSLKSPPWIMKFLMTRWNLEPL